MTDRLVPTRQTTGWTADKQRRFIEALAETGCITRAATAVFMTKRSAYGLRARPEGEAFARAWDMALAQAGGRLLTQAFERALEGGVRRVWKKGELAVEETHPSDRLLMWLIGRIGPDPFRNPDQGTPLPTRADLLAELARLEDTLPDDPPLQNADLFPAPEPPPPWED